MSALTENLHELAQWELPVWLREDPEFGEWLLAVTRNEFGDHRETKNRFDRILDGLRRDHNAQVRKREAQSRKSNET